MQISKSTASIQESQCTNVLLIFICICLYLLCFIHNIFHHFIWLYKQESTKEYANPKMHTALSKKTAKDNYNPKDHFGH